MGLIKNKPYKYEKKLNLQPRNEEIANRFFTGESMQEIVKTSTLSKEMLYKIVKDEAKRLGKQDEWEERKYPLGRTNISPQFNAERAKEVDRLIDEQHLTFSAVAKIFGVTRQNIHVSYHKRHDTNIIEMKKGLKKEKITQEISDVIYKIESQPWFEAGKLMLTGDCVSDTVTKKELYIYNKNKEVLFYNAFCELCGNGIKTHGKFCGDKKCRNKKHLDVYYRNKYAEIKSK